MAGKRRIRWDRVALIFIPFVLMIVFICVQCGKKPGTAEESSRGKATFEGSEPDEPIPPDDPGETDDRQFFTVVIDPGHGGRDGGCTDPTETRKEKDDNLRLSLLVRDYLNTYPGVRLIMTREDDTFISLSERCRIANDADADLFISLHRNAADNASGVEIWVVSDAAAQNNDNSMDYRLAGYIKDWLKEVGISYDRGIRSGFRNDSDDDNYYVNRNTKMPSCLVEMGFMNSDTDNRNFDNRINEYADAIASAIVEMGEDTGLYTEAMKRQAEPDAAAGSAPAETAETTTAE